MQQEKTAKSGKKKLSILYQIFTRAESYQTTGGGGKKKGLEPSRPRKRDKLGGETVRGSLQSCGGDKLGA